MLKLFKKAVAVVVMLIMAATLLGSMAAAAEEMVFPPSFTPDSQTVEYTVMSWANKDPATAILLCMGGNDVITNFKVSDKSIVAAKQANLDGQHAIMVKGKKAGTAKVTFTVKYGKNKQKSQNMTLNVNVKKYVNPLKLLKIGSVKYTSLFGKKTSAEAVLKKAGKYKLTIKLNSGWKITSLTVDKAKSDNTVQSKSVKNGKKVKLTKGSTISFCLENKKEYPNMGFMFCLKLK